MLRAVMDAVNDDTLLPALAINGKCMSLPRPQKWLRDAAEAPRQPRRSRGEGKQFMWARTTATRIVGNLAASNDGEILESAVGPAWQGCELPVPMT
jgi:hypothetical protein